MDAALSGPAGAVVAGVLLCAGTAKLAVPTHLRRAIADLLPAAERRAAWLARLVATGELGTALALSVPATQRLGAGAGMVLGAAFVAAGVAGATRGVAAPCGCFGRSAGKPLGIHNAAVGLVLTALCAALWSSGPGDWAAYDGLSALAAAAVAGAVAGWLYRDMIRDLRRPAGVATDGIGAG